MSRLKVGDYVLFHTFGDGSAKITRRPLYAKVIGFREESVQLWMLTGSYQAGGDYGPDVPFNISRYGHDAHYVIVPEDDETMLVAIAKSALLGEGE